MPQTDDPKPDEPQGVKRADAELSHAYERIKSAEEELARLDRLVSGMERGGDRPPIRQVGTGAEPSGAAVNEAPAVGEDIVGEDIGEQGSPSRREAGPAHAAGLRRLFAGDMHLWCCVRFAIWQ